MEGYVKRLHRERKQDSGKLQSVLIMVLGIPGSDDGDLKK
jgi:hypothetical protein